MARFGPTGSFHRARLVRVYSQGGAALADVEWLRPQVGMPDDPLFLCCARPGVDDTQHRQGLQVSTDIRRGNSPPQPAAAQVMQSCPAPEPSASAQPSLDLLDFGMAAPAVQVGNGPDLLSGLLNPLEPSAAHAGAAPAQLP